MSVVATGKANGDSDDPGNQGGGVCTDQGGEPSGGGAGSESRPVPAFFWLVLVSLLPAAYVAVTAKVPAGEKVPAWALRSSTVYALEVGLVVFLFGYFVALALCLAYRGKSLGHLEALGIAGDLPDPEEQEEGLAEAADGFISYRAQTDGQLDKITENIRELRDRFADLRERVDDHDASTSRRLDDLDRRDNR